MSRPAISTRTTALLILWVCLSASIAWADDVSFREFNDREVPSPLQLLQQLAKVKVVPKNAPMGDPAFQQVLKAWLQQLSPESREQVRRLAETAAANPDVLNSAEMSDAVNQLRRRLQTDGPAGNNANIRNQTPPRTRGNPTTRSGAKNTNRNTPNSNSTANPFQESLAGLPDVKRPEELQALLKQMRRIGQRSSQSNQQVRNPFFPPNSRVSQSARNSASKSRSSSSKSTGRASSRTNRSSTGSRTNRSSSSRTATGHATTATPSKPKPATS